MEFAPWTKKTHTLELMKIKKKEKTLKREENTNFILRLLPASLT
jgi:hypothetical protein